MWRSHGDVRADGGRVECRRTVSSAPDNAATQHSLREASIALLQLGDFGAAALDLDAPEAPVAASLCAGARRVFKLRGADGAQVPTMFVNSIEPLGA